MIEREQNKAKQKQAKEKQKQSEQEQAVEEQVTEEQAKSGMFLPVFLIFDAVALIVIALILLGTFSKKETVQEPYFLTYEQAVAEAAPDFQKQIEDLTKKWKKEARQERFNNSVFLGDSLTEGLGIYGYVKTKNVVAQKGININAAAKKVKKIVKQNPSIEERYRNIIKKIHRNLPEAQIYVESLLPVTSAYENSHKKLTNERINKFNKRLKKLSDDYKYTTYVDIHSLYVNKKGCLPSKISSDGYHLKPEAYEKWLDYVKNKMS